LLVICLLLGGYSIWLYRRDSVELPRAIALTLVGLRLTALAGILFFYMRLERRFERELVHDSRVAVLIDTSQSMGLRDAPGQQSQGDTRLDPVVLGLAEGPLLKQLREQHEVALFRCDEQETPIPLASLAKFPELGANEQVEHDSTKLLRALHSGRRAALVAGILVVLGMVLASVYIVLGFTAARETHSWTIPLAAVAFLAAGIVLGTAMLREPRLSVATLIGWEDSLPAPESDAPSADKTPAAEPDWQSLLVPRGVESRLGDALHSLLLAEQGGTLAGVVLVTDGNRTAGRVLEQVGSAYARAAVPIFPIGMGTDQLPRNVRIVDFEAPQRAYVGDRFPIAVHLQATGLPQSQVQVKLLSQPVGAAATAQERLEEARTVDLAPGELVTERFEVEPAADEVGSREYRVRVAPLENELQRDDNEWGAKVEITSRKVKILLVAGGPMWEYMYLRNQLFRDTSQHAEVSVLLQSARGAISQEAHEILSEFPSTAAALGEYDCIVAFDPDWEALDETQIQLLDQYVGEQAGGLVFVAGGVNMNRSVARREVGKFRILRQLLPVVLFSLESPSSLSRRDTSVPIPLEFTREGREASWLWLGDDSATSERNWQESPGVFSYFPVKEAKPGATVLARAADAEAKLNGMFPIYMASQFYGAGRVFYLGSGEMWRLREREEALFEEFYTKVIRWTSEARTLRDSRRGMLLVDRDRGSLGDRITVRGTLFDEQRRPLEIPEVTATLVQPDQRRIPFPLKRLEQGGTPGLYTEQFVATLEGDYRIELVPPQSEELLSRDVRIRLPDSELREPRRNDAVLGALAKQTGGAYFKGWDAALATAATLSRSELATKLLPNEQTTVLPGTPDRQFDQRLMGWLIGFLVGVLSLEWLLRRWHKLA
jgi:hypothetical protein